MESLLNQIKIHRFFVTGISTGMGKTMVSAVITEALEADYWKPVQVGELDNTDSHKVARLISNGNSKIRQSNFNIWEV